MLQFLKRSGVRPLTAAVLAAGALTGANQSWANAAATSTVRNIITVSYANASGTAQTPLTAAVDVTVNLVKAVATVSAPVDITTDPSTAAVYSYTITNGANGISTYNLSSAVTAQSAGITGSSTSPSAPSVTLGATTAVTAFNVPSAVGGTVSVTVPRDGVADSSINGIANGDKVAITIGANTYVFTASAVTDVQVPAAPANGPYTTTMTLTLVGPAPAGTVTVPVGTVMEEQQTFTVSVTPGTVSNSAVDQTINVTLTATDGSNPATDATVTTVASVGLTVTKLVRNVGNAAGNAAGTGSVLYGGNTYFAGGVTGNPGDTLEYLVVVTHGSNASNATAVKVSDPLPPFTTYVAGSLGIDNTGSGTFTTLTDAADGDAGEANGGTTWFYPGTGATGGAGTMGAGTGGTMGANAVSRMKFSVTIQ